MLRKIARQLVTAIAAEPSSLLTATHSDLRNDEWFETPLKPGELLEGEPRPRSVMLTKSDDRGFVSFLWECDRGRFRWRYRSDEVVHVLEGGAEVVESNGRRHLLEPGDVVFFPLGLKTEWTVATRFRKLGIHRSDVTIADQVRERMRRLQR